MKKWIEFHTENGEIWELFKNIDEKDQEKDQISISGDLAVYRKEMLTADLVSVSVIPAARIIDDVTQRKGEENRFYLKIESLKENWFCFSRKNYTKDEIMKLVDMFTGMNKNQAERIWKAKKLGKLNTYRLDKSE